MTLLQYTTEYMYNVNVPRNTSYKPSALCVEYYHCYIAELMQNFKRNGFLSLIISNIPLRKIEYFYVNMIAMYI